MLVEPTVEGSTGETQFLSRFSEVTLVALNGLLDSVFFYFQQR